MEELWQALKRHTKAYIIVGGGMATIILVNETLSFAERVTSSIALTLVSWAIFGILVQLMIKEIIKERRRKK